MGEGGKMNNWSKTVSFPIDTALSWELCKGTLRQALIAAAGQGVRIPKEYTDTWGGVVSREHDNFVITLFPDASNMPSDVDNSYCLACRKVTKHVKQDDHWFCVPCGLKRPWIR